MSGVIHNLIHDYGVIGVFIGAAAEGELGVLVGGAAARMGQLNPWLVGLAGWVGAFLSTQIFFGIGRSQREGRLVHKVIDKRAFALAIHWIERHPRLFCFGYRFIYGFRVVGPVAISMSQVRAAEFAFFNFFSSLLWAVAATLIGWWFGANVVKFVAPYLHPQNFAIASAVAAGVLVIVIAWRARRAADRRARAQAAGEPADGVSPATADDTADDTATVDTGIEPQAGTGLDG